MEDFYASSTLSLILSWVCAIPLLIGVAGSVASLFGKFEGLPRFVSVWTGICIVVFSPARYLILLLVLGSSYAMQSFSAFAYAIPAGFMMMFLMPILFGVGVYVPFYAATCIAGEPFTKPRLALGMIALPIFCMVGYTLVFLLLPLFGWSTHWLPSRDVVRSANGPATFVYAALVHPDIPRVGPQLLPEPGDTANEQLRNHISHYFVSSEKAVRRHLNKSMDFFTASFEVVPPGSHLEDVPDAEVARMVELMKQAITEARQLDAEQMAQVHPDLPRMLHDNYIAGIATIIGAIESSNQTELQRGQSMMTQWFEWHDANLVK